MRVTEPDRESFNDSLGELLNKKNREKAPEGFTVKIMEIVSREKLPASNQGLKLVPYIAVSIASLLLITSFLVLQESPNHWFSMVDAGFRDINSLFSNINFSFNLSILFFSVVISLLFLVAFDKALGRFANKKTR